MCTSFQSMLMHTLHRIGVGGVSVSNGKGNITVWVVRSTSSIIQVQLTRELTLKASGRENVCGWGKR